MKFEQGRTYWVSNPQHGTQRAVLDIASPNGNSLALTLEVPIFLSAQNEDFAPGGRVAMCTGLALMRYSEQYVDIATNAVWEVTEDEPPIKHPTK